MELTFLFAESATLSLITPMEIASYNIFCIFANIMKRRSLFACALFVAALGTKGIYESIEEGNYFRMFVVLVGVILCLFAISKRLTELPIHKGKL